MAYPKLTKQTAFRPLVLLVVSVLTLVFASAVLEAQGNQLLYRSLKLSNNQPGATSTYAFSFQPTTLETIQIIHLEVCANDPFPGTACTAPVGFDASNAVLASQTGDIGFSISPDSTANKIVLSRAPFSSNGQQDSYTFTNVVNPSDEGSYYVRLQTYQDSDTSGEANHYGGIAFAIENGIDVSAVVPPYLLFCAGVTVNGFNCNNVVGDYVNFGEFSSRQVSQGTTQMLAATNAIDGYTIRVTGTTLTSGNNIIPNLVGADTARPGTSHVGMNLRANSTPQGGTDVTGAGSGTPTNGYNQINFYRFNSGDVIAASPTSDDARKYTATYMVNVARGQSPGVYVSTLTYLALGSF
ncbi:hypothetical protein BH09PAT3_BH09PAT3_6880 [soil metagenome]